jgi:hypothetical protein
MVLGGGCGPANAARGPYASVPELILKSPSEPAQSRLLPVPLDKSLLAPPTFPRQVPEPAPLSFTRRSSGADSSHAENARNPIPTPHAPEDRSLPVAGYSPVPEHHPGSSRAISSIRVPTAGFTDTIPEPSYHMQDDPLAFLNLLSSSDIHADFVTAMPFAGRASPGALSQLARNAPAQQATPPASPESQPEQQRLTGKRRRLSEPKDPKAAKRLRSQRQGDEENLDALYKLLVPNGAGAVQKKDRLGISMSPLLLPFLCLMISVVVVSSPPCAKIDTDTRWFKTTFDDLRAHEGFSNFTTRRVHCETLGLLGI